MPEENSVPPQRFIRTFQTDLAKVQGNEPAGPVALPEPGNAAPQALAAQLAPPSLPVPPPPPSALPTPVPPMTLPVLLTPPQPLPPPQVVPPLPKPILPPVPPLPVSVPVLVSKPIQQPLPPPPAPVLSLPTIPPIPKPISLPVIPPPPPKPPSQPVPLPPAPPKPIPPPIPVLVQKPVVPQVPAALPPVPEPVAPPAPSEPPPVQVEPPKPLLPIPSEEPTSAPLHTFTTDFSSLFKQRKASVATIIAAQQDEQRSAPELYPKPKNRHTLVYIIVGGVFLVLGIVAALYAYGSYLTKNMPVVLAPVAPAPIFVDERVQLAGNGSQLIGAIVQSVGNPIASGHVRLLYTAESLSGTSTVFASLQLPAPGRVLRNLGTEGAMAGVIAAGGTQSPFFILPVSSYGETFAGMLSWETTMKSDMAALFPGFPPIPIATSTASTTSPKKGAKAATTTPPAPVYIQGFKDEIIANHDARVYRDDANRVVLVYGYWDQKTFVIARDGAAFAEIMQRLATSRTE